MSEINNKSKPCAYLVFGHVSHHTKVHRYLQPLKQSQLESDGQFAPIRFEVSQNACLTCVHHNSKFFSLGKRTVWIEYSHFHAAAAIFIFPEVAKGAYESPLEPKNNQIPEPLMLDL